MSKRFLSAILLGSALLSLSACGSDESSKEKELQATIESQSKEIEQLKGKSKNDDDLMSQTEEMVQEYSQYKAVIDKNSFKIIHDISEYATSEYILAFDAKITNNSNDNLPFSTEIGATQILDFFSATQESKTSVYDLSGLMWNMDYADITMKPKASQTFGFKFELKNNKDKVIIISDYMKQPVTVDLSKIKTITEK